MSPINQKNLFSWSRQFSYRRQIPEESVLVIIFTFSFEKSILNASPKVKQ
jgi:hypothetical protein